MDLWQIAEGSFLQATLAGHHSNWSTTLWAMPCPLLQDQDQPCEDGALPWMLWVRSSGYSLQWLFLHCLDLSVLPGQFSIIPILCYS